MQSLRDAVSCFELHFAHVPRLRGMLDVKRQQSNTLHAGTLRLSISLNWKGLKEKLLSYMFAATSFGGILGPHSIREMDYILSQSWRGCTWKNVRLNLLLQVVAWVLVRLQQRVSACLCIQIVLSVQFVLESPGNL